MSGTRKETFEVQGSPRIELRDLPSGDAVFVEGEVGKVEVAVSGDRADDFAIEQDGETILMRAPMGSGFSNSGDYKVRVTTPPISELKVNVASADTDIRVEVGRVAINSASGDVRVRRITGECGISIASGDIRIGQVDGECGIKTASGDVEITSARGELGVMTASGDVRVRHSSGEIGVKSASGDLTIEHYEGRDLEFDTKSGDVGIGLPDGRDIDLQLNSLTGDIDIKFDQNTDSTDEEPGEEMKLSAKTISGDITLFKAKV